MFAQMLNAENQKAENSATQSESTVTTSGSAQKGAGRSSLRKSFTKTMRRKHNPYRAVGKSNQPAIFKFAGGREICNYRRREGLNIYADRVFAMLKRQKGYCCNCRQRLDWTEATFEHENGRGGGRRDDRIWIGNKPINGASHLICNQQRGSKRTKIWHGPEDDKRTIYDKSSLR